VKLNVDKCLGRSCGCTPSDRGGAWRRRDFLKSVGLGAGVLTWQPWQAVAGPFLRRDFEKLVPSDKKLNPDWVHSLTDRGERAVYRGRDLDKIGMPIGGLFAGQLYLGGDGKLWHWDVFNQHSGSGAEHYAKPLAPTSPVDQGFAVRVKAKGQTFVKALDRENWSDVSFIGEYPIGYVEYRDSDLPISISLEAFSPFIPLNTEDSSLPVTVMDFSIKNRAADAVDVELAGWLENAVCLNSSQDRTGFRRNRLLRSADFLFLECSAEAPPQSKDAARPDIDFDDFEHETYGDWTVSGTAFGSGPAEIAKVPQYQGDLGGHGRRVVNSHASAPGDTVEARDAATGSLTSRPFKIERNYISFLIGGGSHKDKTCMNLVVGGQTVLTATGRDNNHMHPVTWDVTRWAGEKARLEIVDHDSGPWGNVGVDDIVFSDRPKEPVPPLASEADFGTVGLALLGHNSADLGCARLPDPNSPSTIFTHGVSAKESEKAAFGKKLVGSLTRKFRLAAGASNKVTFVLAWHMPNLKMDRLPQGRNYAQRFDSALSVVRYVSKHFDRLTGQTRLWHATWYDSTLPYWFLDRTFLNTSILATSTAFRLGNGRFYAWEGVGCCEGTCGHVWQYAHAMARLFPDLERNTRENVDLGLALQPDGAIHFRGEFNDFPAIDAQAGTILRALREHQCSDNDGFLKRIWPRVRLATEWLMAKDGNADGLIESNQHNTLDTDWFGPVAWLSGLYLAALLAAQTMAQEVGDENFATKCGAILNSGQNRIVAELFDKEYFVNKPDPQHLDAINSGTGCEIDQVFGQSWAFQVGLPRVLPKDETVSALKALWRYNFTPDVGPYRNAYKPGRWYAMPGEAGLLMCTFPRSDWDYAQAKGKGPDWAAGYFNECMNGFEYQVAGHMIWEGLLTEGLAITRAVHDRYHPSRRNPWNEVECGDHYARSMASYGVFLAACGFEYHGPHRHLGFAPRVTARSSSNNSSFRSAFTTAQGWGTFDQQIDDSGQKAEVQIKWGNLQVRTLALALGEHVQPTSVKVELNGQSVSTRYTQEGNRLRIVLTQEAEIRESQRMIVVIT
jgi:uncharacterized protein (DUF608 family)